MKVYKVVRNWNKKKQVGYSLVITAGAYKTAYKINEPMTAFEETLGFFVYGNKRVAMRHCHSELYFGVPALAVLECRAPKQGFLAYTEALGLCARLISFSFLLTVRRRTRKIIERIARQKVPGAKYCPTGTVIVKKLTPIKIVWTSVEGPRA